MIDLAQRVALLTIEHAVEQEVMTIKDIEEQKIARTVLAQKLHKEFFARYFIRAKAKLTN